MKRCGSQGFTLIELLVTLAMAAIIVTAAAPSLRSLVQNNRSATAGNSFLTALNLARTAAVQRSVPISVCPKAASGTTCSGSNDWSTGWLVFRDANADGALASAADVIQVFAPLKTGAQFTDSCLNQSLTPCNPTFVTFEPTGMLNPATNASGVAFSLQFPGCKGQAKRTITVTPTGRPFSATAAC